MAADREEIRLRELAEKQRGDKRALRARNDDLRVPARIFRRYQAPSPDTPFAIEFAYNQLGDVRGKKVLELGCGDGENSIQIVNRGGRVSGVDVSDSLIELAKQRMLVNGFAEGYEFSAGSPHELPFPDQSFDVVFGIAILYRLDLELASREIWRVLRPGGYAVFKEPVRNSRLMTRVRGLIPYQPMKFLSFERPLTDQKLKRFAGRFSQFYTHAYQLPFVNVARWFPVPDGIAPFFYQADRAILRRAQWLNWYASVRVIKVVK
jgi:ubiquinone/menaquinone biosynthesis C-methylase UbiE